MDFSIHVRVCVLHVQFEYKNNLNKFNRSDDKKIVFKLFVFNGLFFDFM